MCSASDFNVDAAGRGGKMNQNFDFSLNLRKLVQDSPNYISRTQAMIERLEAVVEQLNTNVNIPLFDSWKGVSANIFSNLIIKCWMVRMNEYIKSLQALKDKFYNEVVPAADDINTMALELVQNTDVTSGLGWAKQSIISLGDSEISDIQKRIKTVIDIYYIKLDCAYQIESLVYNLCYDSFIGVDEISWNRAKILKKIEQLGDLDNALGKYSKAVGEFEELVTDYMKTITSEDAKVVTAENYEAYRVYVTQANMLPTTVPDIYNSERFKALLEMDPRLVSEDELAILTAAFSGLVEDNGDIDTEQMEKFIQSFYVKSEEPIPEEFLATGVPTCQTNLSPLFTMMYASFLKNDMQTVYDAMARGIYSKDNPIKEVDRLLLVSSIMQDVVYNMQTLELIYGDPSAEYIHDLPLIHLEKSKFSYEYKINAQIPDWNHVGGSKLDIQIKRYGDSTSAVDNATDIAVIYIKSTMPGVNDYADLTANTALLVGDLTGALDAIPFVGQAKSVYDLFASIQKNCDQIEEANKQIDNQAFIDAALYLGVKGTTSVVNGEMVLNYWSLTPVGGYTLKTKVDAYNENNIEQLDAQQIYDDFVNGDYDSDSIIKFSDFMYDQGYRLTKEYWDNNNTQQ